MSSIIACIQPDHWSNGCASLSLLLCVRPSVHQSTFWFPGCNSTTPYPIDVKFNMVVDHDMTLIPFNIGIRVGQWNYHPHVYSIIQFEEKIIFISCRQIEGKRTLNTFKLKKNPHFTLMRRKAHFKHHLKWRNNCITSQEGALSAAQSSATQCMIYENILGPMPFWNILLHIVFGTISLWWRKT